MYLSKLAGRREGLLKSRASVVLSRVSVSLRSGSVCSKKEKREKRKNKKGVCGIVTGLLVD